MTQENGNMVVIKDNMAVNMDINMDNKHINMDINMDVNRFTLEETAFNRNNNKDKPLEETGAERAVAS